MNIQNRYCGPCMMTTKHENGEACLCLRCGAVKHPTGLFTKRPIGTIPGTCYHHAREEKTCSTGSMTTFGR